MIPNELIFVFHTLLVTFGVIIAARYGQQALVSTIVLLTITANLFVTQTIVLCGFIATSTDAFVVGYSVALVLLQENYGLAQARRAIVISFAGFILFTLFSWIQLWYLPAPTDFMHPAFATILYKLPRLLIASAIAYIISQYTNTLLYSQLQKKLPQNWFLARTYGSIVSTQLLDTALFSFLGLYGVINNVGSIIFVSYSIKLAAIFITVPLLKILKSLKHAPANT